MKNNKNAKRIIGLTLVLTIVLSIGIVAYANDISVGDVKTQISNAGRFAKGMFGGRGHGEARGNIDGLTDHLNTLIADKTITQEQADKIVAFETKKQEERKEEAEKLQAMTKEERDAYIAQNPIVRTDLCTELVSAGIITQEQADALAKLMPQNIDGIKGRPEGIKGHEFDERGFGLGYDKLVEDKVITQEQADKIKVYLEQKEADRKAELDKLQGMTKEERDAYFAQNPRVKLDLCTELVKAGIITQEQADAITKAMPQRGFEMKQRPQRGQQNQNNTTANTSASQI